MALTYHQAELLHRLMPDQELGHLSYAEAAKLIKQPKHGWRGATASDKQEHFLRQHGLWTEGLTRGQASLLVGEAIKRNQECPRYLEVLFEKAHSPLALQ